MWSYTFEVPILMILLIVLSFYFSRPRLPIRRNRTFLYMIVAETAAVIINLAATSVDNNYSSHSVLFVNIINMLYFMAFFCRAYIMYLFSVSVMKDELRKSAVIRCAISVPMFIGIILSVFSAVRGFASFPHVIYYADKEGYHSGNLYNYLYVCGFFYMAMSLISLLLYWKSLGRRREKYGIFFYNLFIGAALVIRLMLPRYLVMDTVVLMAILIVFFAFINPEFFIDLRGAAFNRVALNEHFEENHGKLKLMPIGVVVRNYNEMSDIYGPSPMEEGMTLIARYLKQIGTGDIIFYLRRGRFVVLVSPELNITEIIGSIQERFKHPWKSPTAELYLSVGFSTYEVINTEHSSELMLATMMKVLDFVGHSESREPLHVTEETLEQAEKEKWVRSCIEKVIEDTGFELFLQPIVNASTGRTVGAEALSRIRDPEGNLIPPGIFIPVAESSGRINELGELVFEETCKYIKETDLEKMGVDWINVNLSPAQFLRTDLAERYASIVEKYGIDPGKVHLEITEGAMVDDLFLQTQISAMTGKGFKFVLDDYGTGYSNLSRLKKCPFINVKLDMSIVWDYCKEPDSILPNMIQAFRHMGFEVTAEGIENEDMAATMTNIGCGLLQGYNYSKPIPAKEFAERYSASEN